MCGFWDRSGNCRGVLEQGGWTDDPQTQSMTGNVEVMPQGEGWRLLLLTAHPSFISKLCCFTERLSVLSCSGVRGREASLAK